MATVLLFLLQLVLLLQTIAATARSDTLHPNCSTTCGKFSVPYPFGMGAGCYRDRSFRITCKENEEGVMMPYWGDGTSTLPVINFSLSQSEATMLKYLSYSCYNASGLMYSQKSSLDLGGTPFTISAARNKFTAIGCKTIAYISGTKGSYMSGCMTFCNIDNLDNNTSSCTGTGTGCCQTSLPENLIDYYSQFNQRSINDSTWKFNPCSYSVVADQDWFKFNVSYLKGDYFKSLYPVGVPLVLDWVVGNVTCEEAKNSSSYACLSSNSACHNSPRGLGYTQRC